MFDLYENIKSICDEHGISVTKLCIEVGLSRSVVSNLKNGRCKTLSAQTLERIANYLGEPLDRVMHGKEDTLQTLKDEEKALLHSYRTMTAEQKRMMDVFIKGLKND